MSLSLLWRPVSPKKGKYLDNALKFILRKKYGNGCSVDPGLVFTRGELAYLTGLADAGVAGAAELIEAIELHDQVEVYTE